MAMTASVMEVRRMKKNTLTMVGTRVMATSPKAWLAAENRTDGHQYCCHRKSLLQEDSILESRRASKQYVKALRDDGHGPCSVSS